MTNLEKRNITAAAILFIMTIAVYNWFVTPHTQYLQAEQQYRQTINSLDTKTKVLTSEITVKNKQLENLRKKYDRQKQGFFEIDQAKDFLSGVQTTAEKNGCIIENFRLLPPREVRTDTSNLEIYQYQTNLALLGGYGNILKFLNMIQNRTEKVQVDSIDVAVNNQTGSLDCGLTISIYTLKVKENTENVKNK